MGNDLPDFRSEWVSAAVEATSFRSGLDADKPASPAAGDIWLARDTYYLYVCNTAGSWEKVAKLYLLLAGGTMTGVIAMGTNKITGLGDPTAAQDAATKAYVDTVNAKLDDVSWSEPVRAVNTTYQNLTGKIKLIALTINIVGDTDEASLRCDTASPPTTQIAHFWAVGTLQLRQHATIIVSPNYYYRLVVVAGNPLIAEWHEWDLF